MELAHLDATAQAELVRRGEASPGDLIDAAIARIEQHNPALNAVIVPLFEHARAAARGLLPDGPFHGVPILIKDILAAVAGVPYSGGLRVLKAAGYRSPRDSYLVESLRRAGFVIVGKTNTSELGLVPTAEPVAWGPSRNPYDLSRSTGGSSGGSAAAVAAGLVPVAHGNDGGGSIRIPASCCGLVGLKPSRGRVSLGPDNSGTMGGLVAEHVLTRSVRDSAAILDCLAGPRPGDPYSAPARTRPYADEVTVDPGPLRVGVATRWLDPLGNLVPVHPDCAAAASTVAALLGQLGHRVEEAEIPELTHPDYVTRFLTVWATSVAVELDHVAGLIGRPVAAGDVEPVTWSLAQMGRSVPAPVYGAALRWMEASGHQVAEFFATYDLWLTPTLPAPPLPLGSFAPVSDAPLAPIFKAAEVVPFTAPFNVTGQPAMSLPLFHNAQGLPIGVQLAAAYGREDLLIRVAAQLERARPFHHRATRT